VKGISTDTRQIRPGDIFFALKGGRFDSHAFIGEAFGKGASLCVVERGWAGMEDPPGALVTVSDTTKALGELARLYRRRFDIPVLAIGGSNGKTTTKEMAADVLGSRLRVLRTEKNFNNQIGVPLTLFRLNRQHEAAVVEIGTNHPGEIRELCSVLEPTHGLVTNVGREHLEFFGDLRGVAREEGELLKFISSTRGGTSLVNADDPLVAGAARNPRRTWSYGFHARPVRVSGSIEGMDSRACARFGFRQKGAGKTTVVQLKAPGRHMAANALAAAAVGLCFGIPVAGIRRALERFRPVHERMQVIKTSGVVILNDTYNANPESVLGALETLASMNVRGRRIVVLGDMLELGTHSVEQHEEIGRAIDRRFDDLLTYGPHAMMAARASPLNAALHYEQKNMLAEYLLEMLSPGDAVLVKGSRGMKMEDIVTFVHDRLTAQSRMRKAGTA